MSVYATINCYGETVTIEMTEEGELFFIDYDIDEDFAEEMITGDISDCLKFAKKWDDSAFNKLLLFLVRNEYVGLDLTPELLNKIFVDIGFHLIGALRETLYELSERYSFKPVKLKKAGADKFDAVLCDLEKTLNKQFDDEVEGSGVEFMSDFSVLPVRYESSMPVGVFLHYVAKTGAYICDKINETEARDGCWHGADKALEKSWDAIAELAELIAMWKGNAPYSSVKDRLFRVFMVARGAQAYGYSVEFGYAGTGPIPEDVWEKVVAKEQRVLIGSTVAVIESYVQEQS